MDLDLNSCKIKVINLDSRTDRWEQVQEELKIIGLTNYNRFSAITEGGPWKGSVMSHFKCVTKEEPGMLLLFEDDVCFEPGASQIISDAIRQLPDDFDMFYMGANVKAPAMRYSTNLFKVEYGVHTNHAILFSENARNVIRENYHPSDKDYPTFDHWLYMKGLSMMKCFVCYPMMAFQRGGMSDVRQEYLDDIYREEMLMNQKRHMI
jgi:GR25 family glycosyltransferase involved in LPS biosynthesis